VVILLAATSIPANEELGIPLEKTIRPVYSTVKYEGVVYRFISDASYQLRFETVDETHVGLFIKPICGGGSGPSFVLSVQWGPFMPAFLSIDSCDGDYYILGAETGYAEK
jgi:hypothetical protein